MEENSPCEKEEKRHDFSFGGDSNDQQNPEFLVDWHLPCHEIRAHLFMRVSHQGENYYAETLCAVY